MILLLLAALQQASAPVELRPMAIERDGVFGIEYYSGDLRIGVSTAGAPAGVELQRPGEPSKPVEFRGASTTERAIDLGPTTVGALTLRLRIERLNPWLVQRTLEVAASDPQRFAATFRFSPAFEKAEYASFTGPEKARVLYDTIGGGPEYNDRKGQTFPVAMARTDGRVIGVVADAPASWENRCQVLIDPAERTLALQTGDGREPYELKITHDINGAYNYSMDGWQSLAKGETRRYTTWCFAAKARSHYDAQVAAHLALANAKGWAHSALEAILRNTSYLLLRRNLMRPESRYIFISGIGYGWKQWVTDGFYMAQALADPEKMIEAYRGIFDTRITYEDNAQYYLIWSVLVERAGGKPNEALVKLAYEFIRKHEKDGIFYPPGPNGAKNFKTYHDMLPYDDDDAPTSDQGFHCGALMAAKELGLGVKDEEIDRAIAGYRRMYNVQGQYFATSLKQQDHVGQDTLYGEALTYAVFGRKLLADDQVLGHLRTTLKIQSPFGMRVISNADGSLLPGHSGEYVFGGSWFLNDAANYLVAGAHGMPADEVDRHLIGRIEKEIAHVPAFHESISTVTGRPHGHILYSWNSGYWWLRREYRKRLRQEGPDPVEEAIDRKLGVVHESYGLRLDPPENK